MGRMKAMVDKLIAERSKGNQFQAINTEFKLMLKGVDVKKIQDDTPDDELIISKILEVTHGFNIDLTNMK